MTKKQLKWAVKRRERRVLEEKKRGGWGKNRSISYSSSLETFFSFFVKCLLIIKSQLFSFRVALNLLPPDVYSLRAGQGNKEATGSHASGGKY